MNLGARLRKLEERAPKADTGPYVYPFMVEVEAAWPQEQQDATVEAAYRDAEAMHGPRETWKGGVSAVILVRPVMT